ncbi:MAG: hypothetical protein V1897_00880 [Pseudomonadota bacterium]
MKKYPRMAETIGVATQVTHRNTMVVFQKTGAPIARAAPTTEQQANCDVDTGYFIQVLAAVTRAAVNIIVIAPKGVMSSPRIIPVPTVVTVFWLSKVAPSSAKIAIKIVAVVGLFMIPDP